MQVDLAAIEHPENITPSGRAIARRIIKNIFSLSIAELIVRVAALATSMFFARVLTVADVGVIAFAGASVGYLSLLVGFGLDTIAVREIAQRPSEVKRYVAAVLAMRGALAVVGTVFLILYLAALHKPHEVKVIIAIVAGSSILAALLTANFAYQALNRTGLLAIRTFVGAALNVSLIFIFVRHTTPLWLVVTLSAGSNVIIAFAFATLFVREFGMPAAQIDRAVVRQWLYASAPIALSNLCIMIYYQFDTVLMALWRSEREVGLYTSAYRVIFLLGAIQLMVNQSAMPTLSHLFAHDKAKLRRFVGVMMTAMACVSLLMTACTWVMAGPAITFLYGQKFSGSMPVLKTLSFTMTLVYNECITAPLLYAAGKQIAHLKCVALGAAVNTVANFILIPRFGMQGAAAATIIAEIAVFGLLSTYARSIVELPVFPMLRVLGAGALGLLAFAVMSAYPAMLLFCSVVIIATWLELRKDVALRRIFVRSEYL